MQVSCDLMIMKYIYSTKNKRDSAMEDWHHHMRSQEKVKISILDYNCLCVSLLF